MDTYNKYTYASANDCPERDPVSWKVYASNDGSTYTLVDNVSKSPVTLNRYTYNTHWSHAGDKYRYIKFEITDTSGTSGTYTQMSEFAFYNSSDTKFAWPSTTTISANLPGSVNEGIENLIDGNLSTKYCAAGFKSGNVGNCTIVIDLGSGNGIDLSTYNRYTYASANDMPIRDPIKWKLYGSYDGTNYILVDDRPNAMSVTSSRKTYNTKWSIYEYRYIKMEITEVLAANDGYIQLSELGFFNSSGTKFAWPSGTSITASPDSTVTYESIGKAIDSSLSTKFCTSLWGSSKKGKCIITIDLGSNNTINLATYNKYSYASGNDYSVRDPVSWNIYGSKDGTNYVLIESVTRMPVTSSRSTWNSNWLLEGYYTFDL